MEQGKGSTLERQLQVVERYCAQHQLEIIERVTDEGSSAYAGTNVQTGNLGELIRRVEAGRLPRDITIVVEQLDRISRLPPAKVIAWIQRVTDLGVSIATANDGYVITAESISTNLMGFMGLVFNSFRAHEESRHKSERLAASWKIKRDRLGNGDRRPITGVCPAWLRIDPNKVGFELIPDRAAIVHEIFQRSADGEGKRSITIDLNRRGIEPWGRGKSQATAWHSSYVQKILFNPAVIGDFQPHTKPRGSTRRVPLGEPISGYFPPVVSEKLWATVRGSRKASRGNDGQRGQVNNLLSGLCRCGSCGGPMVYQVKTHEGTRLRGGVSQPQRQASYLSCALRVRGGSCDHANHYRYEPIEKGIVSAFLHSALTDRFFENSDGAASLVDAEYRALRELETAKARAKRMLDLFEETGDQEARERWLGARTEIEAAEAATNALRVRLEHARGSVSPEMHINRVAAVQDLLDGPPSDERRDARMRTASSLRELIDHIEFNVALYVAIRGAPTVVEMDVTGEILGDITIPNTPPDEAHAAGKLKLRWE
ncbi:DNA invertase Pin-like site-specific DNA recombinase [Brevundimonas variabilis]|uniref:DNA invertase Pin-like site-specific DNA recombinase n=1 Tax=Brevundimonas variabilis TaxID=74312 RepID=A0A7W9CH94_9CAUL|nr:DNA invertase Pin-like site-specific DNA recombinase [Brevundimonas variabilis]